MRKIFDAARRLIAISLVLNACVNQADIGPTQESLNKTETPTSAPLPTFTPKPSPTETVIPTAKPPTETAVPTESPFEKQMKADFEKYGFTLPDGATTAENAVYDKDGKLIYEVVNGEGKFDLYFAVDGIKDARHTTFKPFLQPNSSSNPIVAEGLADSYITEIVLRHYGKPYKLCLSLFLNSQTNSWGTVMGVSGTAIVDGVEKSALNGKILIYEAETGTPGKYVDKVIPLIYIDGYSILAFDPDK
jgi:hypothetical protein